MKIKNLNIKKFRHITNQQIEFGDRFTVITGQNGTGKSSILGWVAQAFNFKLDYKTVNGGSFKTKYSEIFRFCQEKDFSNEYEISLSYEDCLTGKEIESKEKIMRTRYLPKTEKGVERYKVDFDGRGVAIDFPVIYLGLKRLIPLATEKNISLQKMELDASEKTIFSKLSKDILILPDDNIKSERIKSANKDILAMRTDKYGHLGNSAGQDNIGQIISSLLSFKRLKDKQCSDYKGGLLIIDEIDITLYAGSQIKLIENMIKYSEKYNLQVIFTTHSLEILEYFAEKKCEKDKINFLELKDDSIEVKLNPSIKFLKNKIKVQIGEEDKVIKIEVLCEDRVTELWAKNLLKGSNCSKYLNVSKGPFPEGTLVKMAESKHSLFKVVCFVLDGDCREKYTKSVLPQRTVFLPGIFAPEVVLYNFLNSLRANDQFWIENDEINFSKQTCFKNYRNSDLTTIKRWFNDNDFSKYFGQGFSRLFNRWKKDNTELVQLFQTELDHIVSKLY